MAREHDAGAALAQRRDDGAYRQPPGRIHAGGRFVEEHDLRPADDGERKRQALLLPAGQPLERRGGDTSKPQQLDELAGVPALFVVGGEERERPFGVHHRVDAGLLEHDADERGQRGVVGDGIEAEHLDAPRRRPPVSLERLYRRRLARPVRTEDGDDLAGGGGK